MFDFRGEPHVADDKKVGASTHPTIAQEIA